jgi:hypothetical protein
MKSYQFLIFFSIVLLIYSLVNFYIYIRGMQALPRGIGIISWYRWIFLFLSASYVIGRFLERTWISQLFYICWLFLAGIYDLLSDGSFGD